MGLIPGRPDTMWVPMQINLIAECHAEVLHGPGELDRDGVPRPNEVHRRVSAQDCHHRERPGFGASSEAVLQRMPVGDSEPRLLKPRVFVLSRDCQLCYLRTCSIQNTSLGYLFEAEQAPVLETCFGVSFLHQSPKCSLN